MDKHYYDNCVEQAINLYWTTLAKSQGLTLVEEKDFKYVISDSRKGPERIFNIHIGSNITERLYEILPYKKAGKIPDGFLITNLTEPQNLPEILNGMGFNIDTSGLCMVMDLASKDFCQDIPDNFKLIKVADRKKLEQWIVIVNTALFGCELMSIDQFNDIYNLDNTSFYIAFYNNVPVSTCMTIYENDLATLEMVSTLPEYRKKGLATAIIKTALVDLQKARIKTVSLRAEPDGINVYKNIGFVEYCKRVVASCNWELI